VVPPQMGRSMESSRPIMAPSVSPNLSLSVIRARPLEIAVTHGNAITQPVARHAADRICEVASKRTSKRFSTFSAPSIAASDQTTQTTATMSSSDPRIAEIKEWTQGLDRLEQKRLQQQRYAPTQEKTDSLSKLALGAKVERALGRRMTDQDAVFRPKLISEKTGMGRVVFTVQLRIILQANMATTADKTVNGDYGTHQSHSQAEGYQTAQVSDPPQSNAQFGEQNPAATPSSAPAAEEDKPIPKEMIGWYFVEQYYNTMSKSPDRLHLYYTKKSQFVAGDETQKVPVAVGQQHIGERIKELDIQDCKVRVTNVDSQESAKGILVQVIGEMSNKAAPHRKFVQTFVLAEQPTGYYVLNDIFRYIVEEEEEELENGVTNKEIVPALPVESVPATLTSSDDPVLQQHDVEQLDRKLEADVLSKSLTDQKPTVVDSTNGSAPPEASAIKQAEDDAAAPAVTETPTQPLQEAAKPTAMEDTVQPEKPRDPDPTPVASPPKPAKATPAEPPKPAAPQTWAERLAASKGTAMTTTSNGAKVAPPVTPAALKPKTANSLTKEPMTPPTSTGEEVPVNPQQNGASGWQMAGSDNKQRQGRQHSQSTSSSQGNVLGYVKNVTEKVDASILKTVLAGFGRLEYFDVSRQKNCAFVEFADAAAYNAAVAANPHNIGGEQIFVEERRPRVNAYGGNFNGRGGMRGARPNDRPGSQGRGGFSKDGGRGGGYTPRGRGGALNPRGRGGQPQAA
ncbi:MAG: hypothetical protein Q9217_005953, partial [Psora testacea]